jgi:hypothetical protein
MEDEDEEAEEESPAPVTTPTPEPVPQKEPGRDLPLLRCFDPAYRSTGTLWVFFFFCVSVAAFVSKLHLASQKDQAHHFTGLRQCTPFALKLSAHLECR